MPPLPLRRTVSAPDTLHSAILLRGPLTRRNNLKAARKNAAHTRRMKKVKTTFKKNRTTRRKLTKNKANAYAREYANRFAYLRLQNPTAPSNLIAAIVRFSMKRG